MIATRRPFHVVVFATISLVVLFVTSRRLGDWSLNGPYYHPNGPHPPPPPPPPPPSSLGHQTQINANVNGTEAPGDVTQGPGKPKSRDPVCENFPDTSNILVIMKTGASESFDKVPTQLMTVLKCLGDFLIFSDMEQKIAGYHIYDSLETVLDKAKDDNKDFDLYRRQRACPIDQDNCNKEHAASSEGWNLDKYKNIHIAERAFKMRPNYEWYVFVDADTYVLWPNLVSWLRKLSPKKKHYLGSVSLINNFPFGHGGSGYVVSQAAMKEFAGDHPGVANKYDMKARGECCGDYLFALAMKDTIDLPVKQVWPTINGEKPHTLPFGPTHWCHPVVTMHHMNSEEISSFWEFEQRRYNGQMMPSSPGPLVLKDIYEEFLKPKLKVKREDWDNLSDDKVYLDPKADHEDWAISRAKTEDLSEAEKKAHLSFDDCRDMCREIDECFQFRFKNGICSYSRAFMLGKPKKKEAEEDQRWMSGWDIDKIQKWIEEQGECKNVLWPKV